MPRPTKEDILRLTETTPHRECGFQLGDVVNYTNDYGVTFENYKIIGFEPEAEILYDRFIYLDKESYWYPVSPASLELVSRENI